MASRIRFVLNADCERKDHDRCKGTFVTEFWLTVSSIWSGQVIFLCRCFCHARESKKCIPTGDRSAWTVSLSVSWTSSAITNRIAKNVQKLNKRKTNEDQKEQWGARSEEGNSFSNRPCKLLMRHDEDFSEGRAFGSRTVGKGSWTDSLVQVSFVSRASFACFVLLLRKSDANYHHVRNPRRRQG